MRSFLHIITFIILNLTADCEAQVHVVYKSIGEKVHLTFKAHWNITEVKWRKDHDLIATAENEKPVTRNSEKYHIHTSDNSLFIHNLMLNDSGEYKAQTGQWEKLVIHYRLIVHEAVPEPVIDTKLNHRLNSSSVCDILVKCSAGGDSATYNCDAQHCTQTNVTSIKANITLNYTDGGMLECTASNGVSTKRTSVLRNSTCTEMQSASYTPLSAIMITTSIIFFMLVVLIIICFIKLHNHAKNTAENKETYPDDKSVNTVYSVVCKQPRSDTDADSSAAQIAATSLYDVPSLCVRAPQCEKAQKDDTDTVYWKLGQRLET